MRARVRDSDGTVLAVWDERFTEPAILEGESIVAFPDESLESWNEKEERRHNGKGIGKMRIEGGKLTSDPPEPRKTIADKIREDRETRGVRRDAPVTLEELDKFTGGLNAFGGVSD